jgi:adiponectin receptor
MELASNMTAITSGCTGEPHQDEGDLAQASGADVRHIDQARKRRHSFFLPRRKSIVGHIMDTEEGLLLKVCGPSLGGKAVGL